jgi:hypothetical protein
MGDTPDNRRSPVEFAQRLARIRHGGTIRRDDIEFLADYIDALAARLHGAEQDAIEMAEKAVALTARAEKAEAERDALRALICRAVDSGSWFDLLQEARPAEGGQ